MLRHTGLIIISVLLWIHFLVSSVILSVFLVLLWLVTRPFDRRLYVLHKLACFWGALYIWVNPLWSLKILNRDRFDDNRAHIVICNHQSLLDIVVVNSLFKHYKWTSKVENFKLPFVGWVLALNRSIRVYRGSHDAYVKFAAKALEALNSNSSIVVFPEGTRSRTGRMGTFKVGAFMLAHEAKVPLLPVVIKGTAAATPRNGWIMQGKHKMSIKVLDPVPYSDYKDMSVKETSSMIYNIIQTELTKPSPKK